jgi:hypothetical protein
MNKLAQAQVSGGGDVFNIALNKTGNVVTLTVNGASESYTFSDDELNGNVYPMFFVAREADITLSNISYTHDPQKVVGLNIKSLPDKTTFLLNQDLDLSGLKVEAVYEDGSTASVDDYKVIGYDNTKAGTQTLTVTKGRATATFDITVKPIDLTKVTVNVVPYSTTYHTGIPFSATGIEVKADFEDGSTATYTDGENLVFSVNGVTLTDGEVVDSSILALNKDVDVKVTLANSDNYSVPASSYATFKATVSTSPIRSLTIPFQPSKTAYFIGDEEDLTGLSILANYEDGYSEVLPTDAYTVTGFDSLTAGTKTITVTSVVYPSVSTTYTVLVSEKIPRKLEVTTYPQTTYEVGEAWNADGMVINIVYNSDDRKIAVLGTDYTIDTSSFDTSKVGTSLVKIVPTDSTFSTIELPITVRAKSATYWKSLVFGQSSTGVNAGDPASSVTENSDGTVTVKSWHGSGKITGDHDGIAYYYTRVNPADNFSLSADIYVRGYLGTHPGSGATGYYNIDEKRSGQEAFGLMARDVIPLTAKDGLGDTNGMTVNSKDAVTDDNGEPVGLRSSAVFSSNIAIAGGYSGSSWPADPTAASYYKNANINRINLYARTGVDAVDGGGTKYGPNAISTAFPQAGIHTESTNSIANGDKEDETQVGDSYRITLERVNVLKDSSTGAITRRGLKATCVYLGPDESRIGETKTTYMSDEIMNDIFAVQNADDAYVGFFAARWGIIDVSNIDLKVSAPETDPVYNVVEEEEVNPSLSISSSLYTNNTDYTLIIKPNNENGGFLTLKKGDQVLYHQMKLNNRKTRLALTLDANSANTYTAIYTPSKIDNLTSYDDVVSTFTIYHKSSNSSENIYVSPDGKSTATGTREDPMDLVSAIGFLRAGQSIVMLDGTYPFTTGITIPVNDDGAKGLVKTLKADEGANPVIDFLGQGTGFYAGGSYWHIRDLEIINTADNQPGFELGGKNCTVENIKCHDNGGTGFQVSRISASQEYFEDWPSNNIIRNCEVWNNMDSTKINADGFGCKLTVGNGNVFDNCISHHNVDDGWDLYTKLASGAIGETTIVNCATYKQGYKLASDGTESLYGNGGHNGFKMGGENIYDFHFIKDSISFMNHSSGSGVSSNSNPALKMRNVVFYSNEGRGVSLYSDKPNEYCYDIKGVISFNNNGTDRIGGSLNVDTSYTNHSETNPLAESSNNYLMVSGSDSVNPATGVALDPAATFISTDYAASTINGRFPQNADGSYNFNGFLQRKTPYVHDEADAVTMYGCFYNDEVSTEATTQTVTSTETTTKTSSSGGGSSSSSSSAKTSSGSASSKASGTTATSDKKVGTPVTSSKDKDSSSSSNGSSSTSARSAFTDISTRPWAVEAITALSDAGVISGVGNGLFAPDAKAKRCDFIVMLTKLTGIEGTATDNFADVPADAYYANAVGLAKEMGIATGVGDNNFNPNATISRQDMMVLVSRALETLGADLNKDTTVLDSFADSSTIADYAKPYVAALVNLGVVSGTGNKIEANVDITRAQMAVLLYNIAVAASTPEPIEESDDVASTDTATTEDAETSDETADTTTTEA